MCDLVIINPNTSDAYGSLAGDLPAKEPPLWGRLIAGYVADAGFSVAIIDADAEGLSPQEVSDRIEDPVLVCILAYGHQPSASTQAIPAVAALAEVLRPHTTIVVGGHPSALPERTKTELRVTYVCDGEGPETIVELLRRRKGGTGTAKLIQDVPGLVYRQPGGSTIRHNKPAELLPMERLHGNVWNLLPMSLYRAHNWQCFSEKNPSLRQPYASIHTSLGCPYKCSFCCINAPFHANQYRMRKPEDVIKEIEFLYTTYGVRIFKIVDEMFVLNHAHYMEICDGLIDGLQAQGADLNIWAYARVDTVRPLALETLRKAGIKWLALGIESESAYVRDGSNKRLKTDDIAGVVRNIQAAEINVIGNYIFGLPDDTMESMRATLDMAKSLNTEFANFYCAMAYPGSPLYDEAVQKQWPLPQTWEGFSQHGVKTFPLPTATLSAQEILRFRDKAFVEYFSSFEYLTMLENKFGVSARHAVTSMLEKELRRELLTA